MSNRTQLRFGATVRLCAALLALTLAPGAAGASLVEDKEKLDALISGVTNTKAIGLMSKLSLKGDMEKFWKDLQATHEGASGTSLEELEERYHLLVSKLELAVKKKDPQLAMEIADFRNTLWANLKDEESFAALGA